MSQKDFWISVLQRLKPTISKANFLTWFQNTTILDQKDGKVIVGVPNDYSKRQLLEKFNIKILQAVQELDGNIKEIEYEVHSNLCEKGNLEGVDLKASLFRDEEKQTRKKPNVQEVVIRYQGQTVSSKMLNDRYQLNNFIAGRDNALPHAACSAVAHAPGGIYNPLYIYGKVGLGKTHLLQAIGNEILKNDPDKIVKYVTAEKFVNEVVEAIGQRYTKKFKNIYRNVDCLLIDDVQFFARKNSSQQEFFHTFNELYDSNKQIVITSDRTPAELDDLDERLKSRFAMGMVVELLLPDFETRLAILQQKCMEFEFLADPEVLEFIANNVRHSVRGLEGTLRQAMGQAELTKRMPTIRSVAEIIRKLDKAQEIIGFDIESKREEHAKAKTAEEVMDIVASYYRLTADDLVGGDRHKDVMLPRQICMYLIKNELGYSYEKIGLGFGGRNHTTVMHACNKAAQKLKKDVKLVRDVNAIKREMGL